MMAFLSGGRTEVSRAAGPELPSALQSKEEELQGVRDQLQQAQEERDCHLKTINSLKQVTGPTWSLATPQASACSNGTGWEHPAGSCAGTHQPCFSISQEVKDTVDGQRILEKKGSAAVRWRVVQARPPPALWLPPGPQPPSLRCSPQLKDLKRQLHLERKRADKLQERLQDILTNSKSRSGEGPGCQAGRYWACGLGLLLVLCRVLLCLLSRLSSVGLSPSLCMISPCVSLFFSFFARSLLCFCLFLPHVISVSTFLSWLSHSSSPLFSSCLFFLSVPFISVSLLSLSLLSVWAPHCLSCTPTPHSPSLNLSSPSSHSVNTTEPSHSHPGSPIGSPPESRSSRSSQLISGDRLRQQQCHVIIMVAKNPFYFYHLR